MTEAEYKDIQERFPQAKLNDFHRLDVTDRGYILRESYQRGIARMMSELMAHPECSDWVLIRALFYESTYDFD